jgi:uncharacterized alpha-E superfamily protein
VDFLVLDRRFPRAIHHCLSEANKTLHAITKCPIGEFSNPAEQLLGRLCADLAYTHVDTIVDAGLHEFVDGLQTRINEVGSQVFDAFFALRPVRSPDADLPGVPGSPVPATEPMTQSQG